MRSLGIMHGRLSPPENGRFQSFPSLSWRDEFPRAAEAGLKAIEWIWEAYGADVNPLATDPGIEEIKRLSGRHGVAVRSVCADYFMDFPLVRAADDCKRRRDALAWLIQRCGLAGITRIVIPFVDASRMETAKDQAEAQATLRSVLPAAEAAGVELHLETDLGPEAFAGFLAELDHPFIRVNYDSGNSASLGYPPLDEFRAYGTRVGSVHIKDRVLGGKTVPLGTGSTDFAGLIQGLRDVRYGGDFVLQAARGTPGDEVAWSRDNRLFVEARVFQGLQP
jgi:hexulose-6-phosphate isomerase